MTDVSKDTGLIHVLMGHLEKQRLPRAIYIKDKVDQGGLLSTRDIEFIDDTFKVIHQIQLLLDRHPEIHSLAAKVFHLFNQITGKALENEKANQLVSKEIC